MIRKNFAAILAGSWNSFDCCHVVLIAKLKAYGFYQNALESIYDYSSERSQKLVIDHKKLK